MIDRFSVKSFKSLLDVEIELGRVNVFIGANGSGKTNLLEAIGVLGAAASGRVDDESLLRRGVRPGVPALYKSSFRGSRVRPALHVAADALSARYSVELLNPLQKGVPAWRYKNEYLSHYGEKVVGRSPASSDTYNPEAGLAALKEVTLAPQDPALRMLKALRDFCIYTPNSSTLRGLTPDGQPREPVGLSGGRLPEAVLELLHLRQRDRRFREICGELLEIMGWAAAYGTRSVDNVPLSPSVATARKVLLFRDRFMAEKRNELTGYDASEGVLYTLFATVLAVHPRAPQTLTIDNVDHALNPRLARALMERICSWVLEGPPEKQILLTSHNPLLLDGLPLQNDGVRLFVVDRSQRGQTVIQRVEVDENLLAKAREGWTLSRLWVMGHIGGVPDV